MDERILAFEPAIQEGLVRYVRQWFAPEDDVLRHIRQNTKASGLPEIQIRPEEGQILGFLARLTQATRIVEIGTLAGYSGTWLARALDDGGKLFTLEFNPAHARVAREHFQFAGLAQRVEVIEGDAHQNLKRLDGPFDMVFIDAEKKDYPTYFDWALEHVRRGGLITAHNAFRGGRLLEPDPDEGTQGLHIFLERVATDPRVTSTIIPVGDGIAASIVK
jgi:caffeoyl-CoA O-methyltransferase